MKKKSRVIVLLLVFLIFFISNNALGVEIENILEREEVYENKDYEELQEINNELDDNKDLQEIVLDKMTKVCVCKAISKAKIKESIKLGADTLDKVIKDTGACTGSCKGSRCKLKIENLITEMNN